MPRYRQRTTERGKKFEFMDRAAHIVKSEGRAVREVAREFDICHANLHRYLKKLTNYDQSKSDIPPTVGYNSQTRVLFNERTEKKILVYLQVADLYHGLSPKEARRFAYKCASSWNLKCPIS